MPEDFAAGASSAYRNAASLVAVAFGVERETHGNPRSAFIATVQRAVEATDKSDEMKLRFQSALERAEVENDNLRTNARIDEDDIGYWMEEVEHLEARVDKLATKLKSSQEHEDALTNAFTQARHDLADANGRIESITMERDALRLKVKTHEIADRAVARARTRGIFSFALFDRFRRGDQHLTH